jgi:hypothetical protein
MDRAIKAIKQHKQYFGTGSNLNFKDYVQSPKEDGYRGYHLIGRFKGPQSTNRLIEIQFRTVSQHYWATAVEIVDIFTKQALKSNSGDKDWAKFFAEISKLIAVIEGIDNRGNISDRERQNSYVNEIQSNTEYLYAHTNVVKLAKKLDVITKYEGFAGTIQALEDFEDKGGYVLLTIDTIKGQLSINPFNDKETQTAQKTYSELELSSRNEPHITVALVSFDALGGIKKAYPNYVADATEFLVNLKLITSVTVFGSIAKTAIAYLLQHR